MKKRIIIAGGTGFVGEAVSSYFLNKNYELVVLTRGSTKSKNGIDFQHWDGKTMDEWVKKLEEAEVVINLSGKNIDCRFTDQNKKLLLSSRLDSTKVLLEAILTLNDPPKMWINASSGAMYQPNEIPNTEGETDFRDGFLAEMSLAWEATFFEKELPSTKRASLRISLIFGNDGGVFPVLRKITGLLLGGFVGSGQQKMSWMHIDDAVRGIDYIIENSIEGPVNFSTMEPPTNKELMRSLRRVMGIPFGLPAPAFGLKIGAFFLDTEPSLLLNSVNFIPQKLVDKGFIFKYANLEQALQQLVKR